MATIDVGDMAKKVIVTIRIRRPRHFVWRMHVAIWLIKVAGVISPIRIIVDQWIDEPWLYHCPSCGREFNDYKPKAENGWYFTVSCPHCHKQHMAQIQDDQAQIVKAIPLCDHGCEYVEPYGFVPGAGCPIHDH